jgi:hypothetical protein
MLDLAWLRDVTGKAPGLGQLRPPAADHRANPVDVEVKANPAQLSSRPGNNPDYRYGRRKPLHVIWIHGHDHPAPVLPHLPGRRPDNRQPPVPPPGAAAGTGGCRAWPHQLRARHWRWGDARSRAGGEGVRLEVTTRQGLVMWPRLVRTGLVGCRGRRADRARRMRPRCGRTRARRPRGARARRPGGVRAGRPGGVRNRYVAAWAPEVMVMAPVSRGRGGRVGCGLASRRSRRVRGVGGGRPDPVVSNALGGRRQRAREGSSGHAAHDNDGGCRCSGDLGGHERGKHRWPPTA